MPKRAFFVGTRGLGALAILLLTIHGCGNGTSSTAPGSEDAGAGGDDASFSLGGFGDAGSIASGLPTTCIVGTRGCLCDSTGGCAPPLRCAPQTSPQPSLCCNGSDCSSAGGSIGATCSAPSGAPSCTPGITIPAGTATNDNCGYPKTSFVESATICGINAVGGGAKPAIIQVFYNDEHALTLGCATATHPVEPLSTDPAAVHYPQTGDPACVDTMGRLLRPVLYVTDISTDPACTAGDQQKGGPANNPIAIFGSWKSATEGAGNVGTPATADPAPNKWDLTSSADPVPASAMAACSQGYGAELRFEVGLISGHSYRFQVIAHDGDQNKGGDSGENCAVFCAGSGTLCEPGVSMCGAADAAACPAGTACVQGCCLTSIR
jgi:hypothetical protein